MTIPDGQRKPHLPDAGAGGSATPVGTTHVVSGAMCRGSALSSLRLPERQLSSGQRTDRELLDAICEA